MELLSPAGDVEQRATIRLLHYWRSLPRLGNTMLPGINALNPQRNPVGWEKCFLVTLDTADIGPIIEHLGAELSGIMEYRSMPSAIELSSLPELLQTWIGGISEALAILEPIQRSGSYLLKAGKQLQYRSILLPFADYQQQPRYGLGAVTFRTL